MKTIINFSYSLLIQIKIFKKKMYKFRKEKKFYKFFNFFVSFFLFLSDTTDYKNREQ